MIDSLRDQMNAMLQSAQTQSEEAAKKTIQKARRDIVDRMNHVIRSFVQAENVDQWKEVLMDSVQSHCSRAALLRVQDEEILLDVARGYTEKPFLVRRDAAPAIQHAIQSGETTVAANVASEVSGTIAEYVGNAEKIYLFPIVSNGKTLGLLMVDGVTLQSALEMISSAAGLSLQKAQQNHTEIAKIAPVTNLNITRTESQTSIPVWAKFPKEQQGLHARAHRFARVQVAKMQLEHAQAVANGRRISNLYSSLQPQIDSARSQFKDEFHPGEQTMIDYLHLELMENLANNDTTLLGADYPGPLA